MKRLRIALALIFAAGVVIHIAQLRRAVRILAA